MANVTKSVDRAVGADIAMVDVPEESEVESHIS